MIRKPLLIILIVILVILNAGAIWFFWQAKNTVVDFTNSFKKAARDSSSTFRASADVVLPVTDIAGEDFPQINRYPKSIRTIYATSETSTTIQYQSQDAPSLILSYFKTQLANSGWILQESSDGKIIFAEEGEKAVINVTQEPMTRITSYTIELIPR
jgi:hypothetical protein